MFSEERAVASGIHRDVKPDNLAIGLNKKKDTIYLIDFGTVKQYHKKTGHTPYSDRRPFIGTARYASINAHCGIEQGRRDDLESFGYILIYFYIGSLPWQGFNDGSDRQKKEDILNKKIDTSVAVLCNTFSVEFATFLEYARALGFGDKPDYAYLRKLFKDLYDRTGFKDDGVWDWMDKLVS